MTKEITKEITSAFNNVQNQTPLVHCITNYVTVNDCANILLAAGASPIMADEIEEVCDITSICNALVLNIGTLNMRTIESMVAAGKQANMLQHPIILDPVGAGASKLRTQAAQRLMSSLDIAVIRGNISEIKALASGSSSVHGVDAAASDALNANNQTEVISFIKNFAKETNSVLAVTGATDIISDGDTTYLVKNGHPMMSKITGSGCMLTALIGGYCGANSDNILSATVTAVALMGLCGELAHTAVQESKQGTSSFRTFLIDKVSTITLNDLNGGIKIETV